MAIRNKEELKEWWSGKLSKLVDKKITQITYMSDIDAERNDWDGCAVVIILDDGTSIIPMMDDEGNGPGSLMIHFGTETKVAPIIR